MSWTEQELKGLPEKKGVRLRGTDMTRLETFADAAFAFATTMLVISIDVIPNNYEELVEVLKGTPAFAASFAQIMIFWAGHRRWSQRYGLEDAACTLISLGLIFVVLVYVYPLKILFSTLFFWLSGGWLPSQFTIHDQAELARLFVVYGIGTVAFSGALALLYMRVHSVAADLRLNAVERIRTSEEMVSWSIIAATGLTSAAFAWLMPSRVGIYAGFIYFSVGLTMPLVAIRYDKKCRSPVEHVT